MKHSNLDEMQEQQLLKAESRGFWLAYWLLLAVILAQIILTGYADMALGEIAVFVAVSIYLVVSCLRHGIWDRRLKPNLKTNLIGSAIAGVVAAVAQVFVIARRGWGGDRLAMCAGSLIMGLFTAGLCFVALSFTTALYKKRHEKLEKE